MNIIWSDAAATDMEEIYDFYFMKSPATADRIYNLILQETDILKNHPHIAAVEPLLEGEEFVFRSLITFNGLFKVIYFLDNDNIFIYRVWCCRKNSGNIKLL